MIPANELRIGNWYYLENPMACAKVPEQFCSWTQALDFESYGIPIPLGSEILEKCKDFEKIDDDTFKFNRMVLRPRQERLCFIDVSGNTINVLNYLHELQNFCQLMTGKELTINL